MRTFSPVTSREMWDWPEYQALLKRLGVDADASITRLSIEVNLNPNEYVKISQDYFGQTREDS